VLVFKDDTGKTTIRVADFGYSTLATREEASILLPKSKPWNAPEHHFGVFTLAEAKKADVYSFGRLCLWALCGGTECVAEVASFDPSTEFRPSFEELKDDEVEHFAYQCIESMQLAGLNDQQRCCLKEFFKLTLEPNPEKRTADVGKLMVLLSPER
jgi:serine/threonine protein kinase